jgi:hypothetical protein
MEATQATVQKSVGKVAGGAHHEATQLINDSSRPPLY